MILHMHAGGDKGVREGHYKDVARFWDDVIAAYRKQLQKAIPEFEKAGERGRAQIAQLRFETEFCERYLPRGLDETALRALVRDRITALAITDPKQVGRLVGDIMKTHKGQVEAGDVKRLAEELLRKA